MAEMIAVHERTLIPVPANMDWASAGAFPEVFTTAHDALLTQCALLMGERVCVHGAAGGVGVPPYRSPPRPAVGLSRRCATKR